MSKND